MVGGDTWAKRGVVCAHLPSYSFVGSSGFVGFRAVVAVAKCVHVASKEFTFRFDRDGPLGTINPIWDPSYPSDSGWATFRLNMTRDVNMDELREEIKTIKHTLL